MSHTDTPTPPERFNFARHLIALNAGRAGKTAEAKNCRDQRHDKEDKRPPEHLEKPFL